MSKPKVGLIIGCNYSNTSTPLKESIIDANNMKSILIDAYQYDQKKIIMLVDSNQDNLPTKESILNNLTNIISVSYQYSEICLYYSGHGSESRKFQDIPDPAIVPCDYIYAGCISNDDIYQIIKDTQCQLRIIMDCLGSGLNLQYSYQLISGKNIKPYINFTINNDLIINQLITLFIRTDNNKITNNILFIIRENNYSLKYSDILYNLKNSILYTSQEIIITSNYINYLYSNYQYLVDTVNNLLPK
jgi:hypothetical protein